MDARTEVRKQHRMNPETFLKLGRAWIDTKGGFVLGLAEGECQGVKIPFTPRQWGAWRAYFRERGIKTAFMDAKAKATAENKLAVNPHCWTVPTEWPHEFDTEATVQGDHEAGNWFMRNWRPPNPVMADAAQRAITAAKARRSFEQAGHRPGREQAFRPFPKLWEAFADEPGILQGHRFEVYSEASRRLATMGKEAARTVLTGGFYASRTADAPTNQPEEPKGQFIDRDKLLEGYERDMAEHAARKARNIGGAD